MVSPMIGHPKLPGGRLMSPFEPRRKMETVRARERKIRRESNKRKTSIVEFFFWVDEVVKVSNGGL